MASPSLTGRILCHGIRSCWASGVQSGLRQSTSSSILQGGQEQLLHSTSQLQGPGLRWLCRDAARHRDAVASPRAAAILGALSQQGGLDLLHRGFASSSTAAQQAQPNQQQQTQQQAQQAGSYDTLELTTERINAITDKIPQRPVGVVEGTSYSIIILAAFGVMAYLIYQFIMNFVMEPTALQCFNHTLGVLKADPRITVRLGASDDIRAWGSNSTSRVARQQIPHQIYKDAQGQEHVRVQFYIKGPSGTGLVNADMYRDSAGQWQYTYLLVDVYAGSSQNPSRLYIVKPQ